MIPKLYIRLGLIAGVLLLVWYTYNQGVEAGVNRATAKYAESQDKAIAKYQADVRQMADDYSRDLLAIRREYEAEIAKQSEQAKDLARQIAEANTAEAEVREGIRYVQTDGVGIGNDAYRLYQRTRQIIRDPRNPNVRSTTEQTTPDK